VASADALRRAVLAARTVGFSTGPSGTHLARLFERWGIAEQIQGRLVQAPPGVPVGSLVASGEIELGFQQLSELMHQGGISVLGALPEGMAFITTFSAGLCPGSTRADSVRAMLRFMTCTDSIAAKQRHGMEPA
jgi:molybdate transport system substrate-binding protein